MFLLFIIVSTVSALSNGVGKVPALGWNSWNAYGCNINESIFLDTASALISKGFQAAGYNYINLDDCWSVKDGRDNTTQQIIPNPTAFPNGINGLANKLHAMNFKVGIYSSAGTKTCAGYPASIGYEDIDAATFAGWGIDYLKYDNCNAPTNWTDDCFACYPDSLNLVNGTCGPDSGQPNLCPAGYDYGQSKTAERYNIMRDALAGQNRSVLYSLCEWGKQDVWQWGNGTGNSWRTTNDINATWPRIVSIINQNSFYTNYGGFYGHNDWDILELGNGNLTGAESRSHFALWALGKSPLLLSFNANTLSDSNTAILLNKHLLAFNQDQTYGIGAAPYKWGQNADWTFNATSPAQYWSGQSSNGTFIAMFNSLNQTQNMTASWDEVPGLSKSGLYSVTDAWTDQSVSAVNGAVSLQVEPHDTAVLIVKESKGYVA